MELRSGRRLRRSSPQRMDLISALPDELLLLVLARIHCFRTAVQTSVLSCRWRGLWIGLTDLTFRGLEPTRIEALLRRFAASPQVSTIDIGLRWTRHTTNPNSLLRAAHRLSPRKLLFTFRPDIGDDGDIELPCFHGTTSIELDTGHFRVKPLLAGEFVALESLSVSGQIIDLVSLLTLCPHLRVLNVTCPDKHISQPPAREFPTLEKLSLSGTIVGLDSLLNSCQRLRVLSVTQVDACVLRIMPPPSSGEFPVLEKLSLSGNIADLGTLLNQCPRMRVLGVTFRGTTFRSLEAGLTTLEEAAPLGLVLCLLGIAIPWRDDSIDAVCFASLLRTAARLSPQELLFTNNFEGCSLRTMFADKHIHADLPCFPSATSIQMSLNNNICFTPLSVGEFSALETVSLSGTCDVVNIGTFVSCCPRRRVLKVTVAMGKITVQSASLQKLHVSSHCLTECHGIDIVTPVLKQLHLNVHARRDIGVSIFAPVVENVLWQRSYTAAWALVFGSWRLWNMSVQTKQWSYTCWQQLPWFQVLCLYLRAGNHLEADLNFAREMKKLPVTSFSVLELYFESARHVYGALVLQLLRMRRIRAATKKLKVFLSCWPKAKQHCIKNCPCDKPKNWRNQSIFCTTLEEVEIHGYDGEDHEHDFLRLILQCSPMLKSMTARPSETFGGCTKELSNIFLAHPSVKFYH